MAKMTVAALLLTRLQLQFGVIPVECWRDQQRGGIFSLVRAPAAWLGVGLHPTCMSGQMTGFEFLFSFYSLLLGLAVANVATGLADSWRFRARIPLGAPTLLLGLLILLSAAQQWLSFWGARTALTMGPWEVLVAMGMSLPYIFVSQAMLPREHEHCNDLRAYYLENSRSLMVGILVPAMVSLVYNVTRHGLHGHDLVYAALPLLIPIVLSSTKREWLHGVGLSVLVGNMIFRMFAWG